LICSAWFFEKPASEKPSFFDFKRGTSRWANPGFDKIRPCPWLFFCENLSRHVRGRHVGIGDSRAAGIGNVAVDTPGGVSAIGSQER